MRRIACPRCTAPMRVLSLSSHKGQPVTVEHCPGCRLVWFDEFESVQLDSFGWVRLLREMEAGAGRPLADAQVAHPACPQCAATLKQVQNRSRFGLFAALECPRRHGHLHSHSGLLAERGLVRPLGVAERRALAQERHTLLCLNCGGAASAGDEHCSWCGTALVVIDMPRLAHSLRLQLDGMGASPQAIGRATAWPCRACGSALDPARDTQCAHCGHIVVAQNLPDIDPLLEAAEADLAAAAAVEAKRLARYPSTRRPKPTSAGSAWPPATARRSALSGWTPLLIALAAALVAALFVVADLHAPGRDPMEVLRAQRLGVRPGSAWALLPAWRELAPGDRNGLQALRRGLFAVHLRQLAGEPLPATATLGQVIDDTLPQAARHRDTTRRWNAELSRSLKIDPSAGELPLGDEAAELGGRLAPAAPNVWIQSPSRTAALWGLTVRNSGSFTILAHKLAVRIPLDGRSGVNWRCHPAPAANPVLAPGTGVPLFCRTTVPPSAQEDTWRSAMQKLRDGEATDLQWSDEALQTPAGFEAATDRLVADTLKGPASRPPRRSWGEWWSMLTTPRRHGLLLAGGVAAFAVFCMAARQLGERRAVVAALSAATVGSYLGGRGEGAASVLLVGMYLVLSLLLTFGFAFGARLYAQWFLRRPGQV
ncbi:hypothetical protein ASC98_09280 [Rhizobacter sp. Root1238]|nr:hypothetical protein ASC88_08785 [Rhizobacter sp. Root29]KQV98186.1 hypothetical protein ASC98_09280 [Rhizobacter sp. Root1238]